MYLPEQYAPLLYFERAVNFGSGVSPTMPVLMFMLVVGLWIWCQMRRLYLAGRFWGLVGRRRPGPAARSSPGSAPRSRAVGRGHRRLVAISGRLLRGAGQLAWGAGWFAMLVIVSPLQIGAGSFLGWAEKLCGWTEGFGDRCRKLGVQFLNDEGGFVAVPAPAPRADEPVATAVPAPVPRADEPAAAVRPAPATNLYLPEVGPAREHIVRVLKLRSDVQHLIEAWVPLRVLLRPSVLAGVGLVVIASIRLCQRSLPGVDFPSPWITVVMLVIMFLALTIVLTLGRLVCLWQAIGALLRELVRPPMAPAYGRVPAPYAESLGRYLDRARPSLASLNVLVKQWEVVAEGFYRVADLVEARRHGQG